MRRRDLLLAALAPSQSLNLRDIAAVHVTIAEKDKGRRKIWGRMCRLHDSWVESLTLSEPSSGNRHEDRSLEIRVRLLGSHHDGHITVNYRKVQSYSLETPQESKLPPLHVGHGDWHRTR
jgi:hypothetical protein